MRSWSTTAALAACWYPGGAEPAALTLVTPNIYVTCALDTNPAVTRCVGSSTVTVTNTGGVATSTAPFLTISDPDGEITDQGTCAAGPLGGDDATCTASLTMDYFINTGDNPLRTSSVTATAGSLVVSHSFQSMLP